MRNLYKTFTSLLFEDDIVKNKDSGNIYTVKSHNPKTQALVKKDASEEDLQKVKKGEYEGDVDGKKKEVKKLSKVSVRNGKKKLEESKQFVENADQTTKERYDILDKSWNLFLNAETYEQQVEAVKTLAEFNLIEGHAGGKKIYLTSQTNIPYKFLTGASGNAVTRAMNEIISDEGIEVPMRGSSRDKALADMSGKHNEAGVVAYLDPSETNINEYNSRRETLKDLGGNDKSLDESNKKAADQVKQTLPSGSKILQARQVGGIGKKALSKLGINPKVNPTDLIVIYETEDGKKDVMKISSKAYSNPRQINMKNSGVVTAGNTYLGDSSVDDKLSELRETYDYNNETDETLKTQKKAKFKEEYLKLFSNSMVKLTETDEGQEKLFKMWKDVHGCGGDVYTQIVNKKTGDVNLLKPDYYCNPNRPFKVKFNGKKLVIDMDGGTQHLEIHIKTENQKPPVMIFFNINKK